MKKTLVLMAGIAVSISTFAQRAKVNTANEYLRDGDIKNAVKSINEAVASESTKGDGDAWFTRGEIYEKLGEAEPTNTEAFTESTRSYIKVLEVKPGFEKDKIDYKLLRVAYKGYNNGVEAYGRQTPDYNRAYEQFKTVVDIREVNDGKHFAANKKFDTIAALALKYQALSAFYNKKTDLAMAALIKAKNNPVARDAYIFSTLIDLHTQNHDDAAAEKTIDEAKAAFPKNAEILRQEMNFYSRTGKTDLLIQKMEDAAKKDPDNPLLQYNLGVLYGNMANPQDESGQGKEKPANAKEYEAKAEMAYKMAIDADPTKADYVYNLGAMYFNNAADITRQMNAIKGTTAEDNKKYEGLKVKRTEQFTKALPYFQKSYDLLNPKAEGKMESEDATTYKGTLIALQTIYEVMGQGEKGDEMQKKIDAFNARK
jgi:Flp pilus assembly protein TadD